MGKPGPSSLRSGSPSPVRGVCFRTASHEAAGPILLPRRTLTVPVPCPPLEMHRWQPCLRCDGTWKGSLWEVMRVT